MRRNRPSGRIPSDGCWPLVSCGALRFANVPYASWRVRFLSIPTKRDQNYLILDKQIIPT